MVAVVPLQYKLYQKWNSIQNSPEQKGQKVTQIVLALAPAELQTV